MSTEFVCWASIVLGSGSGDWLLNAWADLDVWQTSLHNPNFASFAENCGALGIRVDDKADLAGALATALNHNGPALVELVSGVGLV